MRRVFVIFVVLISVVLGSVSIGACESTKIGCVTVGKVFDEYEKTKEYDKQLEAQFKEKQKELEKVLADIRRLSDELELLSEKGKKEKQDEIDSKVQELRKFDAGVRKELNRQRDNFLKEIIKEIYVTVEEYAKKEKFTIVVRKEGMVIYSKDAIDLTDEIIKIMNERHKK